MRLALSISSSDSTIAYPTRFYCEREAVVGRDTACELTLPCPRNEISRRHAQFLFRAKQLYVVDLSTNGTFLNDTLSPIGKGKMAQINTGDYLKVGGYVIAIELHPKTSFTTQGLSYPRKAKTTDDLKTPEIHPPFCRNAPVKREPIQETDKKSEQHTPEFFPSIEFAHTLSSHFSPPKVQTSAGAASSNAAPTELETATHFAKQFWEGLGLQPPPSNLPVNGQPFGQVVNTGLRFFAELELTLFPDTPQPDAQTLIKQLISFDPVQGQNAVEQLKQRCQKCVADIKAHRNGKFPQTLKGDVPDTELTHNNKDRPS